MRAHTPYSDGSAFSSFGVRKIMDASTNATGSHQIKPGYRQDIEGLRAIAVMSVVLFHLGVPGFSGGFVGVDVFFVISGFLITRLIRDEVQKTDSLDFRAFYLRRIRRLFPALLATIIGTVAVAVFVFSPAHLKRLGLEATTATFSASNFLFWSESGYFDTGKQFKALLHTWSLSVEEQFYLVWPLLILLGLRAPRWVFLAGMVIFFAISLCAAQTISDRSAAFFLMPFRIFEFALGASLVWAVERRWERALEPVLMLGLLMIACGVVTFSASTRFPGLNALVPSVGAFLVIWAGQARFTGWVLRNRLAGWLGRTSYALYLVHWPVIIIYQYSQLNPMTVSRLTASERISLLIVSLALATALHYCIEQPFRRPKQKDNSAFLAISGVSAILTLLVGYQIFQSGGWQWRLTPEMAMLTSSPQRKVQPRSDCHHMVLSSVGSTLQHRFDQCVKKFGNAVLVFGDSHSVDLMNAFMANANRMHIVGIHQGGCRPHDVKKMCIYPQVVEFAKRNAKNLDAVVYSQKGSYLLTGHRTLPILQDRIDLVANLLNEISSIPVPVIWVGPQWEPQFRVHTAIATLTPAPPGTYDYVRRSLKYISDVDAAIAETIVRRDLPITYVSKIKILGPLTNDDFLVENEYTYSDGDHWSAKGEEIFGARLIKGSSILEQLVGLKQ